MDIAVFEAGVDTLRQLFALPQAPPKERFLLADGSRARWLSGRGLLVVETQPTPDVLTSAARLPDALARVERLVSPYGAQWRGISRLDVGVTLDFGAAPAAVQNVLTGLASVQLARCETTRRGHPVKSIWWTPAHGTAIVARVYDKGRERGGPSLRYLRWEVQERFRPHQRPTFDAVCDPCWLQERFLKRFGRLGDSPHGLTIAAPQTLYDAIADDAATGLRSGLSAERLIGSDFQIARNGGVAYPKRTFQQRKRELRQAGYAAAEAPGETVRVNLAQLLDVALAPEVWGLVA